MRPLLTLFCLLVAAPASAQRTVRAAVRAPASGFALFQAPWVDPSSVPSLDALRWVCEAPCETSVRPGRRLLAIAHGDRVPTSTTALRLDRSGTLRVVAVDHSATRSVGAALGIGSGLGIVALGVVGGMASQHDAAVGVALGGMLTLVLLGAVGLALTRLSPMGGPCGSSRA